MAKAEPIAYFEHQPDPDAEQRLTEWNAVNPGTFLREWTQGFHAPDAEERKPRSGSDAMVLFDKTLTALEYLYSVNAGLARALDEAKAATEAADANAARWESYANAAVNRAKSAETAQAALLGRAEAAEYEASREKERAFANEERATAALNELSLFKERLVMFFRKNAQILRVIETLNG